jgi:hypothetical protein
MIKDSLFLLNYLIWPELKCLVAYLVSDVNPKIENLMTNQTYDSYK